MKKCNSVLLDLDGTLLDTAKDLGCALNHLLNECKLPMLPLATIRPYAGKGCKGLLKLGFNMDEDHVNYESSCRRLLQLYQHYSIRTTTFFDGMEETLSFLDKNNIPWGIVTNKPAKFTNQLAKHFHLKNRAGCIISGDSLTHRKPHPEPILHACKLLQVNPENCVYVGDSEIDIIAGKNAGTSSLAALYGYITEDEDPNTWGADGFIKHPLELIDWIEI